jgi:hypothetical protein
LGKSRSGHPDEQEALQEMHGIRLHGKFRMELFQSVVPAYVVRKTKDNRLEIRMLINGLLSVYLNVLTMDIKDDKDSYNHDECVHGLDFVKRVE